jgi:hypothetical protein
MQMLNRVEQIFTQEPERKVYIASAEDTILAKLEWYRLGGEVSEREWRDVVGVVQVQGERLNRDYLYIMAAELGVVDLLEKVLNETG